MARRRPGLFFQLCLLSFFEQVAVDKSLFLAWWTRNMIPLIPDCLRDVSLLLFWFHKDWTETTPRRWNRSDFPTWQLTSLQLRGHSIWSPDQLTATKLLRTLLASRATSVNLREIRMLWRVFTIEVHGGATTKKPSMSDYSDVDKILEPWIIMIINQDHQSARQHKYIVNILYLSTSNRHEVCNWISIYYRMTIILLNYRHYYLYFLVRYIFITSVWNWDPF